MAGYQEAHQKVVAIWLQGLQAYRGTPRMHPWYSLSLRKRLGKQKLSGNQGLECRLLKGYARMQIHYSEPTMDLLHWDPSSSFKIPFRLHRRPPSPAYPSARP